MTHHSYDAVVSILDSIITTAHTKLRREQTHVAFVTDLSYTLKHACGVMGTAGFGLQDKFCHMTLATENPTSVNTASTKT